MPRYKFMDTIYTEHKTGNRECLVYTRVDLNASKTNRRTNFGNKITVNIKINNTDDLVFSYVYNKDENKKIDEQIRETAEGRDTEPTANQCE